MMRPPFPLFMTQGIWLFMVGFCGVVEIIIEIQVFPLHSSTETGSHCNWIRATLWNWRLCLWKLYVRHFVSKGPTILVHKWCSGMSWVSFIHAKCLSFLLSREQASPEQLFPQRESRMDIDGFTLYSRSLNLRFPIDKSRFNEARIILKCVAKIRELPRANRETTHMIIVPKLQVQREMSLNYRSGGKRNIFLFPFPFVTKRPFKCAFNDITLY